MGIFPTVQRWPRSRRLCETWESQMLVHPSQTRAQTSSHTSTMQAHPVRYYGSGELHFITATCHRRQPFLGSPRARDLRLDRRWRHRGRVGRSHRCSDSTDRDLWSASCGRGRSDLRHSRKEQMGHQSGRRCLPALRHIPPEGPTTAVPPSRDVGWLHMRQLWR